MKKKIYLSKGIVFWITGLPGSGKTTIARIIKKQINKKFGPSIVVSGDDLRKIFNLNGYTAQERKKYLLSYNKFCKFITNQKINIIFAVVGLFDFIRKKNKSNLKNYIEIFIDTKINTIIKNKKKQSVYKQKKNVIGIDIKPQYPKNPDIIIKNYFNESLLNLKEKLTKRINQIT